jgi:hypothetical protein
MSRRLPGWLAFVLSPVMFGLILAVSRPAIDGNSLESFLGSFLMGGFIGLAAGFLVWYGDRIARQEHDRRKRATGQGYDPAPRGR